MKRHETSLEKRQYHRSIVVPLQFRIYCVLHAVKRIQKYITIYYKSEYLYVCVCVCFIIVCSRALVLFGENRQVTSKLCE